MIGKEIDDIIFGKNPEVFEYSGILSPLNYLEENYVLDISNITFDGNGVESIYFDYYSSQKDKVCLDPLSGVFSKVVCDVNVKNFIRIKIFLWHVSPLLLEKRMLEYFQYRFEFSNNFFGVNGKTNPKWEMLLHATNSDMSNFENGFVDNAENGEPGVKWGNFFTYHFEEPEMDEARELNIKDNMVLFAPKFIICVSPEVLKVSPFAVCPSMSYSCTEDAYLLHREGNGTPDLHRLRVHINDQLPEKPYFETHEVIVFDSIPTKYIVGILYRRYTESIDRLFPHALKKKLEWHENIYPFLEEVAKVKVD